MNKPVESVSINGSVLFAIMSRTKKMETMLGDKGHNYDGTMPSDGTDAVMIIMTVQLCIPSGLTYCYFPPIFLFG